MAQKKIGDLQLRSDFDATCNVPVDDATQTWRTTGAQILTFLQASAALITGKTADTDPLADDLFLSYDASATALKKVAKSNLLKKIVPTVKTGTATASLDEDVITVTASSAWTLSLPTAVGNKGKEYWIVRTDLNPTFLVTLDPNGSETVGGYTTVTLATPGEVWHIISDGTNWLVLDHRAKTDPAAWTPTFSNFGTAASIQLYSHRDGAFLVVEGVFTSGTVVAATGAVSLGFGGTNANVTSAAIPAIRPCGVWNHSASSTEKGGFVLIDPSVGVMNFTAEGVFGTNTVGSFSKGNASAMGGTGAKVSIQARIPITGWYA